MAYGSYSEINRFPQYLQDQIKRTVESSGDLASQRYQPYRGERQAPFAPETFRAHQMGAETGSYAPYLERANRFSEESARSFPSTYQSYMNPYIGSVVDRIGELGVRNLRENIMPALGAQFAGSGQSKSSRQADLAARIARDTQSEISARQAQALGQGYELAGKLHAWDRTALSDASKQQALLGKQAQAGKFADIAGLESIGAQKQAFAQAGANQAYNDFLNQQAYPRRALAEHAAMLQGLPHESITYGRSQQSSPFVNPSFIDPSMYRYNSTGQFGNLAGQLYSARRAMGYKAGGIVKKPLGKQNLMTQSFMRQPKVGGKHAVFKRKRSPLYG